jgi:hypothetical protein
LPHLDQVKQTQLLIVQPLASVTVSLSGLWRGGVSVIPEIAEAQGRRLRLADHWQEFNDVQARCTREYWPLITRLDQAVFWYDGLSSAVDYGWPSSSIPHRC